MPEQKFKPGLEIVGNRVYINSKIWKGDAANAPWCFFGKWYVNNRGQKEINTIKVCFFTKNPSHPIKDAEKGDIVTFPTGTLKFKTSRIGESREEKIEYAEIVVFDNMTIEKSSQDASSQKEPASEPEVIQQNAGAEGGDAAASDDGKVF